MSKFDRIVGARFRELRMDTGFQSINDMANNSPFSHNMLHRIENEHSVTGADAVKRLAIYFDVSSDYLLGLQDEKRNINSDNLTNEQRQLLLAISDNNVPLALKIIANMFEGSQ